MGGFFMETYDELNRHKEIKVVEFLRKSRGVHFIEAYLDDMNNWEIAAIARELEKRGFTSNSNGLLDITEPGIEYLNKLLKSN